MWYERGERSKEERMKIRGKNKEAVFSQRIYNIYQSIAKLFRTKRDWQRLISESDRDDHNITSEKAFGSREKDIGSRECTRNIPFIPPNRSRYIGARLTSTQISGSVYPRYGWFSGFSQRFEGYDIATGLFYINRGLTRGESIEKTRLRENWAGNPRVSANWLFVPLSLDIYVGTCKKVAFSLENS